MMHFTHPHSRHRRALQQLNCFWHLKPCYPAAVRAYAQQNTWNKRVRVLVDEFTSLHGDRPVQVLQPSVGSRRDA